MTHSVWYHILNNKQYIVMLTIKFTKVEKRQKCIEKTLQRYNCNRRCTTFDIWTGLNFTRFLNKQNVWDVWTYSEMYIPTLRNFLLNLLHSTGQVGTTIVLCYNTTFKVCYLLYILDRLLIIATIILCYVIENNKSLHYLPISQVIVAKCFSIYTSQLFIFFMCDSTQQKVHYCRVGW